jgi:hypothetical protein
MIVHYEKGGECTPFTPSRGTWGMQGIIKIPDRPKDFIFFVTYGQQQGEHVFEEGITESFSSDGSPRYIEVKTTKGSIHTAFYMSSNEVAFAREREMNVKHSNLSRDLQSLATLSKTIMKQKEFEIAHQLDDPVRMKRTRIAGKQMNKKFMKMMKEVIPTERDKEKVIRATERFIELIDEKSINLEDLKHGIGNK